MKTAAAPATAPPRPRGRPRSFDREAALAAAMEVFWQKGFEGASLADLTSAMGINPPSLYAAFGDKEDLFLQAAQHYATRRNASCPYAEEPTAKAAVRTLLTYFAHDFSSPDHPRGCLMMLAAATTGSAPKLQAALAKMRADSRARMRARIERGIREGDVPPGTDAAGLADFYATIVTGLSMQARDGATRKSLLATVERAMTLFPEPQVSGRRGRRERVPA